MLKGLPGVILLQPSYLLYKELQMILFPPFHKYSLNHILQFFIIHNRDYRWLADFSFLKVAGLQQ